MDEKKYATELNKRGSAKDVAVACTSEANAWMKLARGMQVPAAYRALDPLLGLYEKYFSLTEMLDTSGTVKVLCSCPAFAVSAKCRHQLAWQIKQGVTQYPRHEDSYADVSQGRPLGS